jgi:hypothetical protein
MGKSSSKLQKMQENILLHKDKKWILTQLESKKIPFESCGVSQKPYT